MVGDISAICRTFLVHLQMMEVEAHRQFMVARSSVYPMQFFQRGGGHFARNHHAVDAACTRLLSVFVDIEAIGVEATAIARKVDPHTLPVWKSD